MNIVSVQFQNKNNPEEFTGREYTYFSEVELVEGDIILAPTKNGESAVRVCRVNMSDSEISDSVRPYMKTIEKLVRPKEKATVTRQELANMLNGCEYREELTKEQNQLAKDNGLVVVFGASDDLCELEGAICDEVGCYEGGTTYVNKDGIFYIPDNCDCDNAEDCPLLIKEREKYHKIVIKWNDDGNPCWTYETDILHSTFDVMEDGEVYCRGIVFSMEDLK
jgi:hypothetical protein